MRKTLTLLGLLFLSAIVHAQIFEPADTVNGPRMTLLDPAVYDAGTIKQGEKITYEIHLKNTGKSPLLIHDAHGTGGGGFYVASWPTEFIPPGKTDVIKCAYNPEGKMGQQHKSGVISTNGYPAEVRFEFKCTVKPPPPVQPLSPKGPAPRITSIGPALYDAGNIRQGEQISHEFTIKNTGTDTLRIRQVTTGDGGYYVNRWPKDPIPPGASASIEMLFLSAGKMGSIEKNVTICSVDSVERLRLKFKCTVVPQQEFALSILDSAVCHFGTIRQDSVFYHTFRIKNTGVQPLLIRNVDNGCACATADWPHQAIAPGQVAMIKVDINGSGKMGPTTQVFKIHFDHYPEVIEVSLSGNIAPLVPAFPYENRKDGPH